MGTMTVGCWGAPLRLLPADWRQVLYCRNESVDVLAVGCWDATLSFYELTGNQIGEDRPLECDPCCVSYFPNGGLPVGQVFCHCA